MHDNASEHHAVSIKDKLWQNNVSLIFWSAFLLNLNFIETLWNIMKDWIDDNYSESITFYSQLQAVIQEAWDCIEENTLQGLIELMSACCQAIIDINGMHTKY